MDSILFKHSPWKPADVEDLCGLTPVALRDLRRRGLAPASEDRTLSLSSVAQLLLQTELAKHGLGPKSVQRFVENHAPTVVSYALLESSSWVDEDARRAWQDSPSNKSAGRFAVLFGMDHAEGVFDSLVELDDDTGCSVLTVVDLFALGKRLAGRLASRPSSAAPIGKSSKK